MAFTFTGPTLPMTVRACRSLIWTLAALTMLSGVFVLMTATLLGAGFSIPFHNTTLSGSGAVTLGLVYVAAGGVLVWLGVQLGRLVPWVRAAIVGMLALVVGLALFRALELSLSMAINVALCVAVIALLFARDTQQALQHTPQV